MKFDLTRQTVVPAFLTLAALAATAVYAPGAEMSVVPAPGPDALWMPGELLLRFQTAFPGWSQAIAALLIIVTGTRTGHIPVRYNLHTAKTCLTLPLFGIIACGLSVGHAGLYAFACALLLILSVRNFCRAYSPNFAFDAIFRGALYLGTLIILCPKTLPLVLLLPLALVQFHRTLRESIVAAAGLLLPPLALCYADWGAGHPFLEPLLVMGRELPRGEFFQLLADMPFSSQLLGGVLLLCLVFALHMIRSEFYAVSVKAQRILIFHLEAFLLTLAVAVSPGAPTAAFALMAIPAAVLLPRFFIYTRPAVAQSLYAVLLAGALLNMTVQ